jgi:hypothetical protein
LALNARNLRRADDAPLEREHRGGAQPARVLDRNPYDDASFAVVAQRDAPYLADRETREGQVHADRHPFGVVGDQHQPLRLVKRATCIEHEEHETDGDHDRQADQQADAELQVPGNRRELRLGHQA